MRQQQITMRYDIFGPFILPRETSGRNTYLDLKEDALKGFWNVVEDERRGLKMGRGCYVFGVSAGGGMTPWYVGQTGRAFHKECFTSDKIKKYHEAYNPIQKGTPLMFLIARMTPQRKVSKKQINAQELNFLEDLLIGLAYWRNRNLLNKKGVAPLKKLIVPGVMNTPRKPADAALALRNMLGA